MAETTGEAIMICIDTSNCMESKESSSFKLQADGVRYYCTEKLKNPQSVVGVAAMGQGCLGLLSTPTRDIERIMESVYGAKICGDFLLEEGISCAHRFWYSELGEELRANMPKRMVVFARASLYPFFIEKDDIKQFGLEFKSSNVACDVITFGDEKDHLHTDTKELYDAMIDAANDNGNCNVVHVPPESTVVAALLSSQIFQRGGSASQESYSLALSRSQQESSKLNAKEAAASDPDTKISEWSQSSPDLELDDGSVGWGPPTWSQEWPEEDTLNDRDEWDTWIYPSSSSSESKLDNANPVTLDEKIERARQKLESLLLLKNQQLAEHTSRID